MSFELIVAIQAVVNVFLLGFIFWVKRSHSIQKNVEGEHHIQILQSKIATLEDLSDQTERQVQQLATLFDKKSHQLREVIQRAQVQCTHLKKERQKSSEVAAMFQDKIPHSEIIERQKRAQYVTAVKMAS